MLSSKTLDEYKTQIKEEFDKNEHNIDEEIPASAVVIGERLDIVVTDNENKFGQESIDYALSHGISFPLKKLIDELEMIRQLTTDDKSDKRNDRLDFLKQSSSLNQIPIRENGIDMYFQFICNYLNGGDGMREYTTPLILVCSGGNIITIFAKLLYNLFNIDNLNNLVPLNTKYLTTNTNFADNLNELIEHVKRDTSYVTLLSKLGNETAKFSDIDYKLLPNKRGEYKPEQDTKSEMDITEHNEPSKEEEEENKHDKEYEESKEKHVVEAEQEAEAEAIKEKPRTSSRVLKKLKDNQENEDERIRKAIEEKTKQDFEHKSRQIADENAATAKELFWNNYENSKDYEGFVLFRVKSLLLYTGTITDTPNGDDELVKRLIDAIKYLAYDKKLYKSDISKCNKDYNILGTRWNQMFPQMAQQNWLDLDRLTKECKLFIVNLLIKKEIIKISTELNIEATIAEYQSDIQNGQSELTAMIEYLHDTTHKFNDIIDKYPSIKTSDIENGRWEDVFKNEEEVKNNFYNFNKVITENDGILMKVCNDLILHYLHDPDFFTKSIRDRVIKRVNNQSELFKTPKSRLTIIGTAFKRNQIANKLEKLFNLGGIKGTSVTINAIKTSSKKDMKDMKEMEEMEDMKDMKDMKEMEDMKDMKKVGTKRKHPFEGGKKRTHTRRRKQANKKRKRTRKQVKKKTKGKHTRKQAKKKKKPTRKH
jgi:hypothetical protein